MSLEDIKNDIPLESPVEPVTLGPDSRLRFDCHPGIACFNACCRNIDVQLTPYDVIRLKRRQALSAGEFVTRYTIPFEMDHHGLPGLKLATGPGSRECVFLTEQGCGVYEDRPAACRYYALGNMAIRARDADRVEDVYFVVREPHCLGHEQPRTQTVAEYRAAQGVDKYDDMNREWRDVIIKKRSSGPTVGAPSERSLQLFDMCSYDMDSFRDFIRSNGFQSLFDVTPEEMDALCSDDEALLSFSMRFLKQTLFGEKTIAVRAGGARRRTVERQHIWQQRRTESVAQHREESERIKTLDQQQWRSGDGGND